MAGLGADWSFVAVATALALLAALFVLPKPFGRRIAATAGDGVVPAPSKGRKWWRIGVMLVLHVMAAALYLRLGDPAAIDPQRDVLSTQLRDAGTPLDEAGMQQVYGELQQHLQRQGEDARAWVVKGRLDMRAQRFEEAAAAYERALQGKFKTIGDAGLWVEYAEARGMLQGGMLAGKPRELVDRALSLNPDQPKALDLAGSAAWEAGEFALAVHHWQRLLAQIPEGNPRHVQLSTAIQAAEKRARFTLPSPPR
jgi:cytochrome c-type biogenesis protein CcmH